MHDPRNTTWVLDSRLLSEYPEFADVSGRLLKDIPQEIRAVSAAFLNGIAIDAFIGHVEAGEPTGDIEYHLKFVDTCLHEVSAADSRKYSSFIGKESQKLEERKEAARKAIGEKKRDTSLAGGGRYL